MRASITYPGDQRSTTDNASCSWFGKSCRRLISSCLCLFAIPLSGCQQFDLFSFHREKAQQAAFATPENPIVDVICLWEAAEGTGLDGLPCRGFVGQILFFSSGAAAPLRSKGDIRIYVFDDQGTPEEQQKPIHQFDFGGEAFQKFFTPTNIGGAYQLFIPYTRKGTHRATCSLRVRLTPEHGTPIYSKMASVLLSGTTSRAPDTPVGASAKQSGSGIQQASFEAPAEKSLAADYFGDGIVVSSASRQGPSQSVLRARMQEILKEASHPSEASQLPSTASVEQDEPSPAGAPARFRRAQPDASE